MGESKESCDLKYLERNLHNATVWTAFLEPKTQQEAAALIFGVEPGGPIHHNISSISKTRHNLLERNLLSKKENKLRNVKLRANITPLINSILRVQKKEALTEDEIKVLSIILDSDWFREIFSHKKIRHPFTYQDKEVYEPFLGLYKEIHYNRKDMSTNQKRPPGIRLEVENLENRMFQIIYELGYYSHNFSYDFCVLNKNNLICDGKISLFEEILTKNSFDEVIKDMKSTFPSGFFERYVHYLNKYSEIFSRKVPLDFFNYLFSSPALCLIPEEIAISLRVLPYSSSNRPVDMGFLRKKVLYERTNINV